MYTRHTTSPRPARPGVAAAAATAWAGRGGHEHAVGGAFYNGCVVAAVEAVLALLSAERRVVALEVGAGTGGTASSVLPILDGFCERYIFSDVSNLFACNQCGGMIKFRRSIKTLNPEKPDTRRVPGPKAEDG